MQEVPNTNYTQPLVSGAVGVDFNNSNYCSSFKEKSSKK